MAVEYNEAVRDSRALDDSPFMMKAPGGDLGSSSFGVRTSSSASPPMKVNSDPLRGVAVALSPNGLPLEKGLL